MSNHAGHHSTGIGQQFNFQYTSSVNGVPSPYGQAGSGHPNAGHDQASSSGALFVSYQNHNQDKPINRQTTLSARRDPMMLDIDLQCFGSNNDSFEDIGNFTKPSGAAPYVPRPMMANSPPMISSQPGPATAPVGAFTDLGTYFGSHDKNMTTWEDKSSLTTNSEGKPDSGYSSGSRTSATAGSWNRQLQEGYSLVGAELSHTVFETMSMATDIDRGSMNAPKGKTRARTQMAACAREGCKKMPKNPSDARKHEFTHTRPFRCEVPDCLRQQGFATSNDLDRHCKTVHEIIPMKGSKKVYYCAGRGCDKAKLWKRLDNFKAHITRKHKEEGMERIIEESTQYMTADQYLIAPSEPPYGSQSGPSHTDLGDYRSQPDMEVLDDPLLLSRMQDGYNALGMSPRGMRGDSCDSPMYHEDLLADLNMHISQNQDIDDCVEPGYALETLVGATDGLADPFMRSSIGGVFNHRPRVLSQGATSNAQGSHQQIFHQNQLNTNSSSYPDNTGTHSQTESPLPQGAPLVCHCGKEKKRECDMKKHRKRHTRPYGCTYPECHKRFGSRNDWKRHENSQHFQAEMWRCDKEPCKKRKPARLFYERTDVANHLTKSHQRADEVDETIGRMHIGREGHTQFWCGFCKELVQQTGEPHGVWESRFKHIGDHYDKEEKHIDNWLDVEMNKIRKHVTSEDVNKAKRPQENPLAAEQDDGDSSDLGDDGIPSDVSCTSVSASSLRKRKTSDGC